MFAPFTYFTLGGTASSLLRYAEPLRKRRRFTKHRANSMKILCNASSVCFFCNKTTIVFDDDCNSCCFDSQRHIHARRVRILVQITKETEERPICEMSNGTCKCV